MLRKVFKEFVFGEGVPFNTCHASHIAVLPNGNIVAAWFGGEKEGSDDIAIWSSIRENGEWSNPVKVAHDIEEPHWNPVIFRKEDGTLLLFYKVGREISKWYTNLRTSEDNGHTWSEAVEIVPGDRGGRGPVRNKVIQLSDGSLLAPGSTEHGVWVAFADKSTNGGKTWYRGADIAIEGVEYTAGERVESDIPVSDQSFYGRGVIQPTLWESEPGKVHMLLRSTEAKIFRSDSEDYGKTWTPAYATELPNNNSGIDVVKLNDGTLVLAYNPVGLNWGPRTPMALSVSHDNGKTWGENFVLENEPGEYSYPAVITDGKDIYVSYTWKRETIACWKLSLDK